MQYVNCGQFPYPFIASASEGKINISVLEGKGTPVGLFKMPVFNLKEVTLPKCFKMIMFSDGILEILTSESIEDSDKYLHEIFSNDSVDVDKISEQLDLENREYFPDDLTFLMIEK